METRKVVQGRFLRNLWLWEELVDRSKYPYFEIQTLPDYRRPEWRLTTPEDVARLLAEAEATPTIEKESWRRALLARLAEGEATVNELAEPLTLTLPAVSKHLKVLERAGLVVRGRQAQYRPCALDAEPLREVVSWAERYRNIWEDRFDRMDAYLNRLRTETEKKRKL